MGSLVAQLVKNPPTKCRRHKRRRFNPWIGKIPWKRKWQVSLMKSSKDRGAWWATINRGWKESDMTEHMHTHVHILTECFPGGS